MMDHYQYQTFTLLKTVCFKGDLAFRSDRNIIENERRLAGTIKVLLV